MTVGERCAGGYKSNQKSAKSARLLPPASATIYISRSDTRQTHSGGVGGPQSPDFQTAGAGLPKRREAVRLPGLTEGQTARLKSEI